MRAGPELKLPPSACKGRSIHPCRFFLKVIVGDCDAVPVPNLEAYKNMPQVDMSHRTIQNL